MSDAVEFAALGLPEELVDALHRYGLFTAFPIQSATIADAMAGRDVLGKARTGSGKTLGFGLPMLARLAQMDRPKPRKPYAVVLVPTRELAMQVGDALEPYTHALGLSQRLVAGGLSMSKQIQSLERGVHLVVATPGRLADLMRRGHAILDEVAVAVLDEADHMAEMGFGEEIAEILATTPEDGQRLLFSATLDGVVDDLVKKFMHSPVLHDVTDGQEAPTLRHVVLAIPPHEKYRLANRIAARDGRTICFVRTKLGADRVAEEMRAAGVLAVALHGDRSQYERNQAMTEFRAGRLPVLVATDVAARGIHVDAVDLVLQIDPPADYRDYTHRSGRTGRAGAEGLAVTLSLPHQRRQMDRILENAEVDAERAQFRTIDAEALEEIDELTGGQEPSGVPVDDPIQAGRFERGGDRRGGRRERTDGPRGGGRSFHSSDATMVARERALDERERALAERERRLAALESGAPATAAPARPAREERGGRDDRDERDHRDDRRGGYQREDRAPRQDRGDGYQRDHRPQRFDRDDRRGGYQRDDRGDRYQREDRNPRGDRGDRYQREDRPRQLERDDRRGGYQRDDRGPRDDRGDRYQRDDRGERKPRHKSGERTNTDRGSWDLRDGDPAQGGEGRSSAPRNGGTRSSGGFKSSTGAGKSYGGKSAGGKFKGGPKGGKKTGGGKPGGKRPKRG